jgi:hypothetical protein
MYTPGVIRPPYTHLRCLALRRCPHHGLPLTTRPANQSLAALDPLSSRLHGLSFGLGSCVGLQEHQQQDGGEGVSMNWGEGMGDV